MKLKKLKDLGSLIVYEQTDEDKSFNCGKAKNSKELLFVEIKTTKDYKAKELDKYKKFKHENILCFKGCLTSKSNIYCPYDYCNGKNLDRFIENFCGFKNIFFVNELYIQSIIKKIINGLEYLHKNNIIHGGLSFENIWINFKDQENFLLKDEIKMFKMSEELFKLDNIIPKIHYFLCPKDQKKNIENPNTMKYLSPEVLDNIIKKQEIKFNTSGDIWSLGIITYKLLTRQFPFEGKIAAVIRDNIQTGKIILPANSLYSLEIIKFINNILKTDPQKRLTLDKIKEEDFMKTPPEKFTFIQKGNDIELSLNNSDDFIRWICLKDSGMEVKEISEKEKLCYLQSEIENKIADLTKKRAKFYFDSQGLGCTDEMKSLEAEKEFKKLNVEVQKLDVQLKQIKKQLDTYNN
jgi:serine/threonine protein kinase